METRSGNAEPCSADLNDSIWAIEQGAVMPRDDMADLRRRILRSTLSSQQKTDLLEGLEALEADEHGRRLA